MIRDDMTGLDTVEPPGREAVSLAPPSFEAGRYLDGLDGLDISEEEKVALLQTLWQMMGSFVIRGFSVDICGQVIESLVLSAQGSPEGVESSDRKERIDEDE